MMYGGGNRMTRKERVQMYYSMLVTSPGLIKVNRDDEVSAIRTVDDFVNACFKAALKIDAEFEKMNQEDIA